MAIHSQLSIYKTTYDLLSMAVDLIRNMPRDVKQVLGLRIRDECVALTMLIQRANTSRNKVPHLEQLLEGLQVVELLIRLSRDKRYIPTGKYAAAVELTTSIGKQANAWKKSQPSPAA